MQHDLEAMADGAEPTGVSLHRGFPNPVADVRGRPTDLALDLNQLLVSHPSSTYLFRVTGENWTKLGIFDGDVALIDRALTPNSTDLVLTWQNDQFELKRRPKQGYIWGVVSAIIHPYHQN